MFIFIAQYGANFTVRRVDFKILWSVFNSIIRLKPVKYDWSQSIFVYLIMSALFCRNNSNLVWIKFVRTIFWDWILEFRTQISKPFYPGRQRFIRQAPRLHSTLTIIVLLPACYQTLSGKQARRVSQEVPWLSFSSPYCTSSNNSSLVPGYCTRGTTHILLTPCLWICMGHASWSDNDFIINLSMLSWSTDLIETGIALSGTDMHESKHINLLNRLFVRPNLINIYEISEYKNQSSKTVNSDTR